MVIPSVSNVAVSGAAAVVLVLAPGPAVLYIVARSVAQGRMAGFVSDLGIHSATLVHILAAALGFSPFLPPPPLPFTIGKYPGPPFSTWLALKKSFSPPVTPHAHAAP